MRKLHLAAIAVLAVSVLSIAFVLASSRTSAGVPCLSNLRQSAQSENWHAVSSIPNNIGTAQAESVATKAGFGTGVTGVVTAQIDNPAFGGVRDVFLVGTDAPPPAVNPGSTAVCAVNVVDAHTGKLLYTYVQETVPSYGPIPSGVVPIGGGDPGPNH